MKKRYIVKHDHHAGRYGVYDREQRQMLGWAEDKAAAASQSARCNAVEEIRESLNAASLAVGTVLTAQLTPSRRNYYMALRGQVRELRDALPSVSALTVELARYESQEEQP